MRPERAASAAVAVHRVPAHANREPDLSGKPTSPTRAMLPLVGELLALHTETKERRCRRASSRRRSMVPVAYVAPGPGPTRGAKAGPGPAVLTVRGFPFTRCRITLPFRQLLIGTGVWHFGRSFLPGFFVARRHTRNGTFQYISLGGNHGNVSRCRAHLRVPAGSWSSRAMTRYSCRWVRRRRASFRPRCRKP